jgi:hypothetical protein
VGNGVVVGIAVDSHDKVERIHKKALELVASTKAPSACAPRGVAASIRATSAISTATSSTCSATVERGARQTAICRKGSARFQRVKEC